ncbi:MAG TPA: S8 family serine peptidase [Longimicrobium sp.]|nr:S8 family serine peptidase [Longimicrobium sp.]
MAAAGLLLGACDDRGTPGDLNPALSRTEAQDDASVPLREEEQRDSWGGMTAEELWAHGEAYDHVYMVGLKMPGRRRGVWRERVLVTPQDVQAGRRSLHMAGAEVISVDPVLPIARVRVASADALERVRRLPHVDYVDGMIGGGTREVAAARTASGVGSGLMSSGGDSGDLGCSRPTPFTQWYTQTPEGDQVSWSYEPRFNNVLNAWRRSRGDNIRIGLIDTGIDAHELQLNSRFGMNPWGLTRQIWREYSAAAGWGAPWQDTCGHGTRMAGVIAAPQDGQNMVGTAPMSDLISIRVGGDVAVFNAGYVIDAIHIAMNPARPAHIIAMAIGTTSTFSSLSDVIRYYYYRKNAAGQLNGPLFIAATGSSFQAFIDPLPNSNVLYPAELPEVVAVAGVGQNGQLVEDSHYGPGTELAGFVRQGTVGVPGVHAGAPNPTGIDAASGATASVAGIAALVWARYPHFNNMWLRQHLKQNAIGYSNHNNQVGYGTIFAYKAVGGFSGLLMTGPTSVYANTTHTYEAIPRGDGPFAYQWNNGATTKSTSYTIGQYGRTVSVTVTDVTEGRSETVSQYVAVGDGAYVPPCDPNLDPMCPT